MTDSFHCITVTGHGSAHAAPDQFNINIGIEASAPTVRAAYSHAGEAMTAVNTKLQALTVAREAINSSSLNVAANTRWEDGTGTIVTGYTVSSTLTVALRYDQSPGEVIAAVVDTGNNNVRLNGLTPVLSDPAAAQDTARAAAWADAVRAAENYAGLAGRSLGAVTEVIEGSVRDSAPRPMMARALMSADASMPIEPGQSSLSLSVQVTWELN